jgi:hypothetical protein
MVPGEGFEPPTFGLQNRCTATVLTRLALRRYLFASERSTRRHNGLTASLNSLSSGPEMFLCDCCWRARYRLLSGPAERGARPSGTIAIADKFVERDCGGGRDIDCRLLAAGRQPCEVIAALAHEPAHAAALGSEH